MVNLSKYLTTNCKKNEFSSRNCGLKKNTKSELDPKAEINGKNGWKKVLFPKPFKTIPVVIVQTQTFVGVQTPGIRIGEIITEDFWFRPNEVVVNV